MFTTKTIHEPNLSKERKNCPSLIFFIGDYLEKENMQRRLDKWKYKAKYRRNNLRSSAKNKTHHCEKKPLKTSKKVLTLGFAAAEGGKRRWEN